MSASRQQLENATPSRTEHLLPLTEPGDQQNDATDERVIKALVHNFYNAVRRDALLGPIFEQRVTDWTRHLARMCDFWSTLTLRTGRYAGRPIEVHARIAGLSHEHFHRWLALWRMTVTEHVVPNECMRFIEPAARMAQNLARHCVQKAGAPEKPGVS